MTRDYRAGAPVPARDLEAFRRAKAIVDETLAARRLARDAEASPVDRPAGPAPIDATPGVGAGAH